MSIQETIVGQFRKPHGLLGRLAGRIMANRPSNQERNAWTIEQLHLGAGARVLEIGCGPGVAIEKLLSAHPDAEVTAIDHSALMLRQAAARNQQALKRDRLHFYEGSFEVLDAIGETYTAAFSCNVMQFIDDKLEAVKTVRRHLLPGAVFATTFQPRSGDVSAEAGRAWIGQMAEICCQAGFCDVEIRELELQPVPAFCVVCQQPEPQD
jgi:ubiquinone/menaquinone biosynthesis C-methylase UbiE